MMHSWVYRGVRPTAWLMDRLRFSSKLMILSGVFLVSTLVSLAYLIPMLNENIDFSVQERVGLTGVNAATDLLFAAERLRVERSAGTSGTARAAGDAAMGRLESWVNGPAASWHLEASLAAIKLAWPGLVSAPDAGFVSFASLVSNFLGDVSDASNITLDPEMSTYFLGDVLADKMPGLVVQMGGVGSLAAGVARHPDQQEGMVNDLRALRILADDELDRLQSDLAKIAKSSSSLPAGVATGGKAIGEAWKGMAEGLATPLTEHQGTPAAAEKAATVSGAGLMAAQSLQAVVTETLETLLEHREHDLRMRRIIVLGSCATAMILALYLYLGFLRSLRATLRGLGRATEMLGQGEYPSPIRLFSRDELQDIADQLANVSIKLAEYDSGQKAAIKETARIMAAIAHAESGIMITDAKGVIGYHNKTAQTMFETAAADLRQQYPDFDALQMVGRNFDMFHANAAHQRKLLADLKSPFKSRVKIGQRTFDLMVNPVTLDSGERVGFVVEWVDRTEQIRLDTSVAEMVTLAIAGDFSKRIHLDPKSDPIFLKRADNINRLVNTVATGLAEIERVFGALSQGDLTVAASGELQGDFARILDTANRTVERLDGLLSRIRDASTAVDVAASEISSGNNDLSSRTEQQAASLEETASAMEELTSTVRNTADNARSANGLATKASETATEGGQVTERVVATMESIRQSSARIADIISVIDGIAFQTNILALNAAVEAARAGEHGRGFAVVASEVRVLANRCSQAAQEIKQLVTTASSNVNLGSDQVKRAGLTIQKIVESVSQVTLVMQEIAQASAEQTGGIEQVNLAITHMDQATQQNAALVEESAAAAESMRTQAADLLNLVQQFRLRDQSQTSSRPVVAIQEERQKRRA